MIEWITLPDKPHDELEEETYLIYLKNSARAISAIHDANNKCFFIITEDAEHVYPYRYISHYAEMDWPDDEMPMISWCEHGNLLSCDECGKKHQSTESKMGSEK